MDINRMTQKSQEALQEAQNLAIRFGHQEVDAEHMLLALVAQPEGLIPRLFHRMNVPLEDLIDKLKTEVGKRPRVSGPGIDPQKVFVTKSLSLLLVAAEDEMRALKDEYLSVEHLLLAMIKSGTDKGIGKILASFKIDADRFLTALTDVRRNQRVVSQNPEQTYEALEKFGRWPKPAKESSTQSSAGTRRFVASSGSCRARRRIIQFSSASPASAKQPLSKVWHSEFCVATSLRG